MVLLDTILVILVLITTILNWLIIFKNYLTMFQQNAYYYKNYMTWYKNNTHKIYANYFLIDILMFSSIFVNEYLFSIFAVLNIITKIFVILFKIRISQRTQRIKLTYTARIKRLMSTITLLVILMIIFAIMFLGHEFWSKINYINFVMIFVSVYLPQIILVSNYINTPIEQMVRNYYINDAKKIINNFDGEVIGLAGSYGKTSTKNYVFTILSEQYFVYQTPASYNSTMGITISIRTQLKTIHDLFLVELGAKQNNDLDDVMELTNPDIAILSSIGPQHLETFKSMENIINTKFSIVEKLKENGKAFINIDNDYIRNYEIKNKNINLFTYGVNSNDADYQVRNIEQTTKGSKFDIFFKGNKINEDKFETSLLGDLNLLNVCVGVAIAHQKNIPLRKISLGVKKIVAPEHRLQLKKMGKYVMIDDAYNSNPLGSSQALKVLSKFEGRRICVTPGMIELGEKQSQLNFEFGEKMNGCTDYIILVGRKITPDIKLGIMKSGFNMENVFEVSHINEAFNMLNNLCKNDMENYVLFENDLPDVYM